MPLSSAPGLEQARSPRDKSCRSEWQVRIDARGTEHGSRRRASPRVRAWKQLAPPRTGEHLCRTAWSRFPPSSCFPVSRPACGPAPSRRPVRRTAVPKPQRRPERQTSAVLARSLGPALVEKLVDDWLLHRERSGARWTEPAWMPSSALSSMRRPPSSRIMIVPPRKDVETTTECLRQDDPTILGNADCQIIHAHHLGVWSKIAATASSPASHWPIAGDGQLRLQRAVAPRLSGELLAADFTLTGMHPAGIFGRQGADLVDRGEVGLAEFDARSPRYCHRVVDALGPDDDAGAKPTYGVRAPDIARLITACSGRYRYRSLPAVQQGRRRSGPNTSSAPHRRIRLSVLRRPWPAHPRRHRGTTRRRAEAARAPACHRDATSVASCV